MTLPPGRNGLIAWRMAVLATFREPSLGRHVHRALLRSVLLDVTPIIAATACHQRNYVERYSRFIVSRQELVTIGGMARCASVWRSRCASKSCQKPAFTPERNPHPQVKSAVAAPLSCSYGYIVECSCPSNARSPRPWGKLFSWRLEPLVSVVPERCAYLAGRGTYCFITGHMISPSISLALLRCSSLKSSRAPIHLPWISRLPLLLPSTLLSGRGPGASRAHRVRLRQGRRGRHAPVAAARFVGQSL